MTLGVWTVVGLAMLSVVVGLGNLWAGYRRDSKLLRYERLLWHARNAEYDAKLNQGYVAVWKRDENGLLIEFEPPEDAPPSLERDEIERWLADDQ